MKHSLLCHLEFLKAIFFENNLFKFIIYSFFANQTLFSICAVYHDQFREISTALCLFFLGFASLVLCIFAWLFLFLLCLFFYRAFLKNEIHWVFNTIYLGYLKCEKISFRLFSGDYFWIDWILGSKFSSFRLNLYT